MTIPSCTDTINAKAESFMKTLKVEAVYPNAFEDQHARQQVEAAA